MKPLEGITVVEFCQFMAGPSAGLRLADLGARVIKVERPNKGEGGRQIAIKNLFVDNSSLVFHTINRNKDSFAANLKDPDDLAMAKALIAQADVVTHNFRPGVMEKIGLGYDTVKTLNPKVVYAVVSGYGTEGPWAKKPGQDLLVQCMSGLAWLTGDRDDGPVPFGLAVADIVTGMHLVQGILAALIRRGKTGQGALVEVSLLASMADFQFEVLTTHLNDSQKLPQRAKQHNAHAYLSAPYGIYPTQDGHIAIAMGPLDKLANALDIPALMGYHDASAPFAQRDEIMSLLKQQLAQQPTNHWLGLLEAAGLWASDVFDYKKLLAHPAYQTLGMSQVLDLPNGEKVHTTRCAIRWNDQRLYAPKPAPRVGQHTQDIIQEFGLQPTA